MQLVNLDIRNPVCQTAHDEMLSITNATLMFGLGPICLDFMALGERFRCFSMCHRSHSPGEELDSNVLSIYVFDRARKIYLSTHKPLFMYF